MGEGCEESEDEDFDPNNEHLLRLNSTPASKETLFSKMI